MPKISVIVPVYNAGEYLHRCVDSILAQTFADFELLLIDDGSKDSSAAICNEYAAKDSRVRVFHKENGGVSSARNLGLDNVKGEWITFVDSDDYVLPAFLATFVELSNSNLDLCIQGIVPNYEISSEYKIIQSSFNYKGNAKGALLLLNQSDISGSLCNKLFRNSIIRNNNLRLNEFFNYREDEEFLLRYMLLSQNVTATKEGGYVYIVPNLYKYNCAYNLETLFSMYNSVVQIYEGKANDVTDYYQIELCNELISMLRVDFYQSIKLLPRVMGIIGWRILRISPMKATFKKIVEFIKK
jgi:glycosyltransferase involved in cell wall biosynthesis